ncbi:MAG: SDR family NAD(P)-dependent oxidoreductase [bacterium]
MNKKLLNIKNLNLSKDLHKFDIKIKEISKKDIAIIGMAGSFGSARNINEFWDLLRSGTDFIREFPYHRRKYVDEYYRNKGVPEEHKKEYMIGGFLENVDEFDYNHFSISPKEANLMDPHQRLFLQTAWNAIEDAGYGGEKIRGTNTGIFLGYSSDFGEEYKEFIKVSDPESLELAVVPNLRSAIASRISYLLDLTGPSMLVDTACSSALMALHLACKSLQRSECDMAIAGSIRLLIMPTRKDREVRIGLEEILGVESKSGRTRTFDDDSDGTGLGEGVGTVVLKSLNRAIEDNDHVYAVIKGSATNQDGSSIGMTAPNLEAQATVIKKAWQDAGVNPETISYIEVHGTGTNLGDPIEIKGLEKAFRHYSNKKQFCSIGSVKTNVGHLDNAAGIVSLFKAVLSMIHGEIPPNLHFNKLNRKINLIESPVFVNDILREWKMDQGPRRCGISSFGLSGTNCHIVLEEAPSPQNAASVKEHVHIFSLSATSEESLLLLLSEFKTFLEKKDNIDIESLCYTANTGRDHYSYRLALVVHDIDDLKSKLNTIDTFDGNREVNGIFYKRHWVVPTDQLVSSDMEISEEKKKIISSQADETIKALATENENRLHYLMKLSELYVRGAHINWEELYQTRGYKIKKMRIPTYPFAKKKCWVKYNKKSGLSKNRWDKKLSYPLIDTLALNVKDTLIFSSTLSVAQQWVLNEHRILGQYVLPGTTYIEMIMEIIHYYYNNAQFQLSNITFLNPMFVEEGQYKEIQIILNDKNNYIEFIITSKSFTSDEWIIHAEGRLSHAILSTHLATYNLENIKKRLHKENIDTYLDIEKNRTEIEVGARWECLKTIYISGKEFLAFLELPDVYADDLLHYITHPALLDSAVNVLNSNITKELYLPFSYKAITFFQRLPRSIWCYLRKREKGNVETTSFDITILDKAENRIAEIEEYTIKKVNSHEKHIIQNYHEDNNFYHLAWKMSELKDNALFSADGPVILLKGESKMGDEIVFSLTNKGINIIEVDTRDTYLHDDMESYYEKLFNQKDMSSVCHIIHMGALSEKEDLSSFDDLQHSERKSLYSLFYLIRYLIKKRIKVKKNIILLADYAYPIEENQRSIKPMNASFFALASVAMNEYEHLKIKCLDIDEYTSADIVLAEINATHNARMVGYRKNKRFIQELRHIELNNHGSSHVQIKKNNLYMITGGTGALGLEVCKFLSAQEKIKLCLINRSVFPSKDKWESILTLGKDKKLIDKIITIKKIEESGTEIICQSGDISDYEKMRSVIASLKRKYGKITGIIHCAGVAGQGFIINKEEKNFREVVNPKIQGTWILDHLMQNDNVDFFIMFSSISSFMAERGQGDYAAANAYLDSFASYRNKKGKRTLSINWPAWKETGMAVDFSGNFEKEFFKPIATENALEQLDKVLKRDINSIIIASLNDKNFGLIDHHLPFSLSHSIEKSIKKFSMPKNLVSDKHIETRSIIIRGKDDESLSITERKVAHAWAKILDLEEVHIRHKFQDLGGDSIMSVEIFKEMDKVFPGVVDIADIFTYSTIESMSHYIDKQIHMEEQQTTPDYNSFTMEEIFEKLEKGVIDIEEADKLISFNEEGSYGVS